MLSATESLYLTASQLPVDSYNRIIHVILKFLAKDQLVCSQFGNVRGVVKFMFLGWNILLFLCVSQMLFGHLHEVLLLLTYNKYFL